MKLTIFQTLKKALPHSARRGDYDIDSGVLFNPLLRYTNGAERLRPES
ncbi:hypothetical protein RHD99_02100 [Buttiauxella selenatireducens]|uniref:Uncharacterized protein n=1 Tax=Buttiauxella selenatireducens TaxID=3073902 RepID=A0ABY9SB95_9ENTR|nr:hypothetical protein [Buttiauxella sp. R73]WMY74800.1 hypothetical protein RHD99_02100 [Buttiauxella sp. R73]